MSPLIFISFLTDRRCVIISLRADHPFHVSQLFIILNRTEFLLDLFATGLEDGTYPRSSLESVSSPFFLWFAARKIINNCD
jgi:hypothetical protein